LGATGQQGLLIFSLQAFSLGFIGAVLGAVLGVLMQGVLTQTLRPYLPFSFAFQLSWYSIGKGFVIGCMTSVLFALLPLIPIKNVSPLNALRGSEGVDPNGRTLPSQKVVLVLISALVFLFAYFHLKQVHLSLVFVAALLGTLGLFWATAKGLTVFLRKIISQGWPYSLRQGLANLYRPNNQTTLMLTSLGFGVFLILVIVLTHQSLLKKFSIAAEEGRPNMGLFDIKNAQIPGVKKLIKSFKMPVLQSVPIVSMRLGSIKGVLVTTLRKQEGTQIPKWALNREYRSTYRNVLNNNEKITGGEFHGGKKGWTPPYPVSIEEGIAEDLGVGLGDEIVFDVYGRTIPTRITSIRKVDWYQIQPTFFMVFPVGVLEDAPQFHVLSTNAPTSQASAALQRAAAKEFPEISVIDLRIVLELVDRFVRQISSVIRFLIIITGLIMLVGTLTTSRFQRKQEVVLLRTLGASQRQVTVINLIEYVVLGVLAVLTGLIPSLAASWALTEVFFKSEFYINVPMLLAVSGSVILVTVVISILNLRPIIQQPPMEVLRGD